VSPAFGLGRGRLGSMPLGGAESLDAVIESPISDVFRRIQIKRRQKSDGKYEANWQDITAYVKKFGVIESAIDDVDLNRFTHEALNFVVDNDAGKFNREDNLNSLWRGYLTRYRTLVRVQAGYTTDSGELPLSDTTVGIFVLDKEISIKSNSNDILLRAASLWSIFDEVKARDIPGISATLTASEIIAIIRDHSDGSGNLVFREFITSTAWTIETTTTNYLLNTDTALQNMTVWELIEQLAVSEAKVPLITRTGGFEFRTRDPRQASVQWTFKGQDFPRPTIQAITDYKESTDKYYNRFRLKFLNDDTTTSYVETGTALVVNDTNTAWLYGDRVYEFENRIMPDTATAQATVSRLHAEMGATIPTEAVIKTEFVPQIELLDRVAASYHSYNLAGSTRWDVFDWAPDTGETGGTWSVEGENFDWNDKGFKILSRKLDLDDFSMEFRMREL
jgi:hypothetical protein